MTSSARPNTATHQLEDASSRLTTVLQKEREHYEPLIHAAEPRFALAIDAPRSARALVESVLLTLVLPAVGWLLDPTDPFFSKHAFPWPVFAPLLIGLRHGFAAGCTSALALGAALVTWWHLHPGSSPFPAEPLLGLLALAMVSGQFSDLWRREARSSGATLERVRRRAMDLARAHFLLELSHERLEERAAGTPNLRDALVKMNKLAVLAAGDWALLGERVLAVFASYARLEVGAIVGLDAEGLMTKTIASLGQATRVDPEDALLVEAIRSRELTYLPTDAAPNDDRIVRSRLLAAVPLVDTAGTMHAVLCVQAMPFVAFHRKNLEAMAMLAGNFADVIPKRGSRVNPAHARKVEFDTRLSRALSDVRRFRVPSLVAALAMQRGSAAQTIADTLLAALLRSLDVAYQTVDSRGNALVLVLVPMADVVAGNALRVRIERVVRSETHLSLEAAGVTFTFRVLSEEDTAFGVVHLLTGFGEPQRETSEEALSA